MLGKLLGRMGDDNVMWGTDAIWLGSPQAQIMAFRTFEITEAFQERYGYPALTADRKAKILGLNAARVFAVGVEVLVDDGLVPSPYEPIGYMTRREVLGWWRSLETPWSPI